MIIKFRSWVEDHYEDNVPVNKNGKYSKCTSTGFAVQYDPSYKEYDVEQFTGEQVYSEDEWTEVFVGDILYFTVFDCYGKDTQYTGTVIFDSGRFQIECKGQNYDDSDICFDIYEMLQQDDEPKVIGNKHENNELLVVK